MSNPQRPSELKAQAGLRLKAARLALGVSRQDIWARQLGVEEGAYGHWERGRSLADIAAMVRLFDMTGIGPDWIYAGSLRSVPYQYADELRKLAAELGAIVGASVVERPIQVKPAIKQVAPARKRVVAAKKQQPQPLHDAPNVRPLRRAGR